MVTKKLSLRGLAKYMTASPHVQRKILHEFKYPNQAAAAAMRHYYVPATEAITLHHADDRGADWLRQRAAVFDAQAAAEAQAGRARKLASNAKALRHYARNFADREFTMRKQPSWRLTYGDVIISVRPDLHVVENGKVKVIRLGFLSQAPDPRAVRIETQCLFEAAAPALGLTSSQVLHFDVPRASVTRGARLGARLAKDIEATCATISTLWDSI
ncbi:MAG: hypothetical protein AB7O97_08675 [Planctomycetota bacterium]